MIKDLCLGIAAYFGLRLFDLLVNLVVINPHYFHERTVTSVSFETTGEACHAEFSEDCS